MNLIKRVLVKYRDLRIYARAIKVIYKSGLEKKMHLFFDFVKLHKTEMLSVAEYFNYSLYDCSEDFRNNFLSYDKAMEYWAVLNPSKYAVLARDKFVGHCLFPMLNIPSSKLYFAYNEETNGTKHSLMCHTINDVVERIKSLGISEFVAKPAADSAHGKGVGVYCVSEIKELGGGVFNISEILGKGTILFESLVHQTAQMSELNKSSVNTVRIITALYPKQEVKIIASFLKIGRAGSCIDNAGSGGNVDCAVDIDSGKLYNALQFNSWGDIKSVDKHPDNGAQLNGIFIENWDKIKERVKFFQAQIPWLKTIGWDVALTDDGPIIIEINNWWDTTGQLFIGRGWHKEVKDCYDAWVQYYNTKS